MFYVIKSVLGNYLRADAEAFVADVRQARRYGSWEGATGAIERYWGAAGPKYMIATAVTIRQQRQER